MHPPGGAPGVGDRRHPDLGAQHGSGTPRRPGRGTPAPRPHRWWQRPAGSSRRWTPGRRHLRRVGVDPVGPGVQRLPEILQAQVRQRQQERLTAGGVGELVPQPCSAEADPGHRPRMPTGTAPSVSATRVTGRCARSARAVFRSPPALARVDRSRRANHAAADRDPSRAHTPDSSTADTTVNRIACSELIAVDSSPSRSTPTPGQATQISPGQHPDRGVHRDRVSYRVRHRDPTPSPGSSCSN